MPRNVHLNLRKIKAVIPWLVSRLHCLTKIKRNIKAFDIIDELTENSYENNGTFTADAASTMYPYLQQMFGKEFEVVYDKGNILETPVKEKRFYYSYNDRLERTFDKEIYAILKNGNDLIYIYEIE